MPPTATIVDALEPVIAPKSAQVTTTVMPRPPGKWPTSVWMKVISRADSPPLPMMFAAKTKNGIASSGKLSSPANTRCGRIESGIGVVSAKAMNAVPVSTMNIGSVRKSPSASSTKTSRMVSATRPPALRSVVQIHDVRAVRRLLPAHARNETARCAGPSGSCRRASRDR